MTAEEAGTLAVWAYPQLLSWPADIAWLFSPVANERPGDLWGVDSNGDLLIIETKRRKASLCDPFEKLAKLAKLEDEKLLASPDFEADALLEKWRNMVALEREWLDDGAQCTPTTRAPGVLPYSSHRATIARWRGMFDSAIRPVIESDSYDARVKDFLKRRKRRNNPNPRPHFMGLVMVCTSLGGLLSKKGHEHFDQLAGMIDRDHTHLRAVRVRSEGGAAVWEQVSVP